MENYKSHSTLSLWNVNLILRMHLLLWISSRLNSWWMFCGWSVMVCGKRRVKDPCYFAQYKRLHGTRELSTDIAVTVVGWGGTMSGSEHVMSRNCCYLADLQTNLFLFVYAIIVYLITVSVARLIQRHTIGWSVHDEFGRLWQKSIWCFKPIFAWKHWSQWPRGLRGGSAAARFLGLRVGIPPGACMSVSCECCVLSGRGLCVGLVACPKESYRLWCVWVRSWSLDKEKAMAH
jgi:hypothetical protein